MLNEPRLTAYRDPPSASRTLGPTLARVERVLRRRSIKGPRFARQREVHELRQLFELFGEGDRLQWTSSVDHAGDEPFIVPLAVVAYTNLSPHHARNISGLTIFDALSNREWRALRDHDGKLFLSNVWEAFFPRLDDVRWFHEELDARNIDPSSVFLLNNNLLSADAYLRRCAELTIDRPVTMLPFPGLYWLFRGHLREQLGDHEAIRNREQSVRAGVDRRHERPYKFLSLNGQIRPHRLVLALHLESNGTLDQGQFSLLAPRKNRGEGLTGPHFRAMVGKTPLGSELSSSADAIAARMPMSLDVGASNLKASVFASPDPQLYDDSYLSIVTDTSFQDDDVVHITEKPFKACLNFHPFVYMGNQGALAAMRDLGFQTFHPYIDESYDEIADHWQRVERVLAEVDRLLSLTMRELHDLYRELWPRLEWNYELITSDPCPAYRAAAQDHIWGHCGLAVF